MPTQYVSLNNFFSSQSYDVKKIFKEFAKPIFNNIFFMNIDTLRTNSDYVEFNADRWYQQPLVFCLDVYNEPQIYPVIMLVNNIMSFLQFTPDYCVNVRTPTIHKHVLVAPQRSEIRRVLSLV